MYLCSIGLKGDSMSGRSDTCQSKNVLQISWIFQPYAFIAHLLIDSIFSSTRNADQTHSRRAGSAHLIQGSWDGLKGFQNCKARFGLTTGL